MRALSRPAPAHGQQHQRRSSRRSQATDLNGLQRIQDSGHLRTPGVPQWARLRRPACLGGPCRLRPLPSQAGPGPSLTPPRAVETPPRLRAKKVDFVGGVETGQKKARRGLAGGLRVSFRVVKCRKSGDFVRMVEIASEAGYTSVRNSSSSITLTPSSSAWATLLEPARGPVTR